MRRPMGAGSQVGGGRENVAVARWVMAPGCVLSLGCGCTPHHVKHKGNAGSPFRVGTGCWGWFRHLISKASPQSWQQGIRLPSTQWGSGWGRRENTPNPGSHCLPGTAGGSFPPPPSFPRTGVLNPAGFSGWDTRPDVACGLGRSVSCEPHRDAVVTTRSCEESYFRA